MRNYAKCGRSAPERQTADRHKAVSGQESAPKQERTSGQEAASEQESAPRQERTPGQGAASEQESASGQRAAYKNQEPPQEGRRPSRNDQEADVSSKRIFGNHTLCAQFLRDYSELPMLANVQPEDIEDVTERYHLFREVEFDADTVKKVHLRGQTDGNLKEIYIISLIEHKSEVDYDVTMQILKYMVCIWENEVSEAEAESESRNHGRRMHKNKRKNYRYPPIYPIVYYEGTGEWTAARRLKERIMLGELFAAYIPDFTYRLVRTQDYSNEELLSREDAISLLMLLNKI